MGNCNGGAGCGGSEILDPRAPRFPDIKTPPQHANLWTEHAHWSGSATESAVSSTSLRDVLDDQSMEVDVIGTDWANGNDWRDATVDGQVFEGARNGGKEPRLPPPFVGPPPFFGQQVNRRTRIACWGPCRGHGRGILVKGPFATSGVAGVNSLPEDEGTVKIIAFRKAKRMSDRWCEDDCRCLPGPGSTARAVRFVTSSTNPRETAGSLHNRLAGLNIATEVSDAAVEYLGDAENWARETAEEIGELARQALGGGGGGGKAAKKRYWFAVAMAQVIIVGGGCKGLG